MSIGQYNRILIAHEKGDHDNLKIALASHFAIIRKCKMCIQGLNKEDTKLFRMMVKA